MNNTLFTMPESVESACMKVLAEGAFTADEVAELIDRSVLAVRPTITTLGQKGYITRTGERRANFPSGKMADVWVANTNMKYVPSINSTGARIPKAPKKLVGQAEVSVKILKSLGHTAEKIEQELSGKWAPEVVNVAIHNIFNLKVE